MGESVSVWSRETETRLVGNSPAFPQLGKKGRLSDLVLGMRELCATHLPQLLLRVAQHAGEGGIHVKNLSLDTFKCDTNGRLVD